MSLLKKALIFLPFTLAAAPAAAQYPQLNKVAKAKIDSMEQAWAKHQAEVWAKCEPIVKKEHAEGRPYVPWAGRPTDLPQAKIPAFPGAEGGGMYSFGGRGGKVYVVTSLADSGPGTLREACEAGGARIVVFNVSGIIRLESH